MSNGANNALEKYNFFDLAKLSSTEFLVKYSLGIDISNTKNVMADNDEDLNTLGEYVADPTYNHTNSPIIYIYNTHQTESYSKEKLEAYSIRPTVLMASYILRERLNDLGLPSIVETENVADLLNAYNYSYGKSYKISRMLLEQARKNYPSLLYYIDIHRDSASYNITTTTIDGEKYARVLFVVGVEYSDYEPNLKLANDINALFNKYYPTLSRGVITKSGKGVNGIYNQDFSDNAFLIEVGGEYNDIIEVNNTINAFSDILFKYIKGEANE